MYRDKKEILIILIENKKCCVLIRKFFRAQNDKFYWMKAVLKGHCNEIFVWKEFTWLFDLRQIFEFAETFEENIRLLRWYVTTSQQFKLNLFYLKTSGYLLRDTLKQNLFFSD